MATGYRNTNLKIDEENKGYIVGNKDTLYELKIFYEDILKKDFEPEKLGIKDEGNKFRYINRYVYDKFRDLSLFDLGIFNQYTKDKIAGMFCTFQEYVSCFGEKMENKMESKFVKSEKGDYEIVYVPVSDKEKEKLKNQSLNNLKRVIIENRKGILSDITYFDGYDKKEWENKKAKAKLEYETGKLDKEINKELTQKNKSSINLKYENFKFEVLEKFRESDLPEYLANPVTNFLNSKDFKEITNDLILENIKKIDITNEEIKDRYDIKEKLPNFKVFTDSGLAFSSDKTDKEFIEEYAKRELEEIIGLNTINPNDVRSFEKYSNEGLISIYYEKNGELQRYYDYEDFIKTAVEEIKNKDLIKEYEKCVQIVKMDILNSCEHTINKEYISNEKLEKLENKYNSKIEIYQSNIEKSNIEIESLNVKKNTFVEEYQNYINSKNETTNEKDRDREF